MFRSCYGYEPWLLAPEKGVRALISNALQLYAQPITAAAASVQAALQAAAEGAAVSVSGAPEYLQQPLLDTAQDSIAGWHGAARRQLKALLAAEQACPDNEAFAELRQRLSQLAVASEPPSAPALKKATVVAAQDVPTIDAVYFMGLARVVLEEQGGMPHCSNAYCSDTANATNHITLPHPSMITAAGSPSSPAMVAGRGGGGWWTARSRRSPTTRQGTAAASRASRWWHMNLACVFSSTPHPTHPALKSQ